MISSKFDNSGLYAVKINAVEKRVTKMLFNVFAIRTAITSQKNFERREHRRGLSAKRPKCVGETSDPCRRNVSGSKSLSAKRLSAKRPHTERIYRDCSDIVMQKS